MLWTFDLHTHTHTHRVIQLHTRSVTRWTVQLQGSFAPSLPTIDAFFFLPWLINTNAAQMATQMHAGTGTLCNAITSNGTP